jgi:hypothetical protein
LPLSGGKISKETSVPAALEMCSVTFIFSKYVQTYLSSYKAQTAVKYKSLSVLISVYINFVKNTPF